MARLTWDSPGNRRYESGVEQGALFVRSRSAVSWSGLISVNHGKTEGEIVPIYQDGVKTGIISRPEENEIELTAFTYPDAFEVCIGQRELSPGMFVQEQKRIPFSLVYKTFVGDDFGPDNKGEKIHIIYNATATSTDVEYQTLSDDVEPTAFAWNLQTVPVPVPNAAPTSHFTVDSSIMDPRVYRHIEKILYGTPGDSPRLLYPKEIIAIANIWEVLYPVATKITYEWTGERYHSPSVKKIDGVVVERNLLTDPSFEGGSGVFRIDMSGSTIEVGRRESNNATSGKYVAYSHLIDTQSFEAGAIVANLDDISSVDWGNYVGFSAAVIRTLDLDKFRVQSIFLNSSGSMEGFNNSPTFSLVGDEEYGGSGRYHHVMQIPNKTTKIEFRIQATAPQTNTEFEIDDWRADISSDREWLEERIVRYFDGDTQDEVLEIEKPNEVITYEWEGERYNSTSIKKVNGVVVAKNTWPNPSFHTLDGPYSSSYLLSLQDGSLRMEAENDLSQFSLVQFDIYEDYLIRTPGSYLAIIIKGITYHGFNGGLQWRVGTLTDGSWLYQNLTRYDASETVTGVWEIPEGTPGSYVRLVLYFRVSSETDFLKAGQFITLDNILTSTATTREEALALTEEYFDGDKQDDIVVHPRYKEL